VVHRDRQRHSSNEQPRASPSTKGLFAIRPTRHDSALWWIENRLKAVDAEWSEVGERSASVLQVRKPDIRNGGIFQPDSCRARAISATAKRSASRITGTIKLSFACIAKPIFTSLLGKISPWFQ